MTITVRLVTSSPEWVFVIMWVNGGMVTDRRAGNRGLRLRSSEIVDFIMHINPHAIEVYVENMPDHIVERLKGFPQVTFI